MRHLALFVLLALAVAPAAHAARHTQLVLDAANFSAEYSQGIAVSATLFGSDGTTPIPAADCVAETQPPCTINFFLAPANAPTERVPLAIGAEPVTDANGVAVKRVVFVDGTYPNLDFIADEEGTGYVLSAEFLGFGLVPGSTECSDPEDLDGDYCPASAAATLTLSAEQPAIALTDGREGALGDPLELSAVVTDPNGDAQLGSSDLEGPSEKLLVGVDVTFFYDADGDARPDANETIDTVQTNVNGVAALTFLLDPQFVRAGTFDNGIHAEFSGDQRYQVGRASTRLIVRPGDVDPAASILEIDPKEAPADGNTTVELLVRLVDENGNLLDETSDVQEVRFESTIGALQGDVVRDPNIGVYTQKLRATREGGDATVTVFVNDVEGASGKITWVREGCQCGSADLRALLPCLLALMMRRRNKGAR